MSAVRGLIAKLQGLREELITPRLFYAAHLDSWRELARTTVREVLLNLRPETTPDGTAMDPVAWARNVELAAEHVSTTLLTIEDAGMIIRLATESTDGPVADVAQRFGFSLEEIQKWVADGREGVANAKRIDDRDTNKSDKQIAWRIIYTLKFNAKGAEGLRSALSRYFGQNASDEVAALYPEVLAAWVEVFTVQAAADFQQWVASRARGIETAGRNRFGI